MYRGSLQEFYCKKGTHGSLDVPCVQLNVQIIQMRQYLNNILKCKNLSDDIKEGIYHCLGYFKKCHNNYIIMTI